MSRKFLWVLCIPTLLLPAGCTPGNALDNANMPNKLVISRTISANESAYPSFPKLTIKDPNKIGVLYDIVVNAQNSRNSGPEGCTNDLGIHYHLDFYYKNALVLAVNADPGGCGYTVLSTGTVVDFTGNLFWYTLASDTGLSLKQMYSGQ